MEKFDYTIIGAGVIGCSLARLLAGAGKRVALIDRAAPGTEASHAAAGMLAPSAEADELTPLFSLATRSRSLYTNLVAELIAETGIDPHYRTDGTLLPFATSAARDHMLHTLSWQMAQGARVEQLSSSQLSSREAALSPTFPQGPSPGFGGALYLPDDHQVDNRLLMQALVSSCRLRGVDFVLGQSVSSIVVRKGRAIGVAIGPESSSETITAGAIINASGAWAAQITGDGIPAIPVRPVKGHMLALRAAPGQRGGQPRELLRHVIRTEEVYLVPRHDGRIIVGSTMEEAGFDKTVHAAPVARLQEAAQRLCPALASAEKIDAWTGLRPATPDGLPVIGPLPQRAGIANYWTALGHFRNGILLAPITAEVLTHWLLNGQPPFPMDAFLPDRFAP